MSELKPCPFCGGEAVVMIDGRSGKWTFHHDGKPNCPAAYAHYASYETEAEAIAAWNTRAEAPSFVRCRDCWHFHDTFCYSLDEHVDDDGFCAWGKRRME